MKKGILWIIAGGCLVFAIIFLAHICYEGGKERVEKDLVYGIASRSYQKVGRFILYPTKDGSTLIEFNSKPFSYAGAGDNTKQGGK